MGFFSNLIGQADNGVLQNGILATVPRGARERHADHGGARGQAKMTNADGIDIHALTPTAYEGVPEPNQLAVGNAVPASALPLLYPGSKLHARLGDDPNAVVVDGAAGAAT